jgi:hypothetical protein
MPRAKLKSFDSATELPRSTPTRRPAQFGPMQIGKDTLMPLGMVVGLLLGVIGCCTWLDSRFDALTQNSNSRFTEIATGLRSLDNRLRDLELKQHHRWDSLDMKDWMLELKRLNPDLQVPPVPPTGDGN